MDTYANTMNGNMDMRDVVQKVGDAIEAVKNINAADVVAKAMSLPGTKVNRRSFLQKELMTNYSPETVQKALDYNPAYAGIPSTAIDKIASSVINYEANKVSGISFLAGIPGGVAMIGTVPADILQYSVFVLRTTQKLAYLYGFDEFEVHEDNINDETMNKLLLFMGIMLGVDNAGGGIRILAESAAENLVRTLPQKALTKGTVYPIVKKVANALGVKMTKQVFAKGISKTVPVLGGVASFTITEVSFRMGANSLKRCLRVNNLCNPEFYKNNVTNRATSLYCVS